jgi:hypothetical protein
LRDPVLSNGFFVGGGLRILFKDYICHLPYMR